VRLRIRARHVMIAISPPTTLSALNVLAGNVGGVSPIEEGLEKPLIKYMGGLRHLTVSFDFRLLRNRRPFMWYPLRGEADQGARHVFWRRF
jgi:hypothetical protein